ncbi:MAG: FAD:protein FMN transferase [Thermodesulfobacteriota bacterium]
MYHKKTTVMGTELEMTASGVDEPTAQAAFSAAVAQMERIEQEMSEWREGTYVSEVNRLSGVAAVKVPDELFKVVSAAQLISRLTDGAFDISWASMRGVWDFRKGHEKVPRPGEVMKRLRLVDYREIDLDPGKKTIYLRKKGMAIGLGAIAKGYAVDRAMEALVSAGVRDGIVRAGGDMRVQGTDESGRRWVIGIRHPRKRGALIASLPATNVSISTSGDYERFFIKEGVLYHHIMDPRTGYPARGCRSVTIFAPDTMTSDALSTAVFVLGPEKGMELIEGLPGVEGIIVDANGAVKTSTGVRGAEDASGKE